MASDDYKEYSKQLTKIIQAQVYFENLKITSKETRKILANKEINIDHGKFLIAWNLKQTWKFLFMIQDYTIDFNYILYLNKLIMKNLIDNNGKIRSVPVKITNCNYQPKMVLETQVKESIEQLIKEGDIIKLGLYIAKTQIFNDGNKRSAIMLINKSLICENKILNLTKYNEKELKNAMLEYYETNNDQKFRDFIKENTVDLVKNKAPKL